MNAREIFNREIKQAEDNYESSVFIGWLTDLRNEVLATLPVGVRFKTDPQIPGLQFDSLEFEYDYGM